MRIPGGQKGGMRAAVSRRNPEALRRADHDIRPQFPGRGNECERQQIGGNDSKGADRMGPLNHGTQITNRPIGGRILEKRAKHPLQGRTLSRSGKNPNAQRLGPGAEQGDRLGACRPVSQQLAHE